MKNIIVKVIKSVFGFFGVNVIFRRKNYSNKVLKTRFNNDFSYDTKSNQSVVIFLCVGLDTIRFVLNSVMSFRAVDSKTKIIIFTNHRDSFEEFRVQLSMEIESLDIHTNETYDQYHDINSDSFKEITRHKWLIIKRAFQLGYKRVIYSDFDIFFMDNFNDYIDQISDTYPILIQSEGLRFYPQAVCTGFMVIDSGCVFVVDKLIELSIEYPYTEDQQLFNEFLLANEEIRNRVFVLPESLFVNGSNWKLFSTQVVNNESLFPSLSQSFMFHANFVVGLSAKRELLKELNMWKIRE